MRPDGRASWCGLNHQHGRHGETSKEPCPGWNGPKVKPVRERSNQENALRAVEWLNGKARELGMARRYKLIIGVNGERHRLTETIPEQDLPVVDQPIGRTYAEAIKALDAMNRALAGVLADRHRSRMATLNGTYDRDFILPGGS